MPTLADLRVPPPRSWAEFEDIVCSAAKNRWCNPDFTHHGRQGQRQDGVDIYGGDHKERLVGIQCKNTWDGITLKTIEDEILKAESFQPRLKFLYLATTAETDKNVQRSVREISAKRKKNGDFEVAILFWADIWSDLTRDESRLFQHYPALRPIDSGKKRELSHDQMLFQKFQSALSFNPAIRLLRDHDFRYAFPARCIEPISEFVDSWDQPEKTFSDSELQSEFTLLNESLSKLSEYFADIVVTVKDGKLLSAFPDHMRSAGKRPGWIKKEVEFLNNEARLFFAIYEKFVHLCIRKLWF